MKKLYGYFKKVRIELKTLLLISIVGYFLIVWLNIFPEIFTGANKVGDFFSKLCIAYTTSFIFYFVVVHIKAERDKENVGEYVAIKLSDIITVGHLYFEPFLNGKRFEDLKPSDLTRSILDKVKRNEAGKGYTTLDGTPYTWLQIYEYHKKSTFEALDIIFRRYSHLDSKLIKLLSRIEDSMMYFQWQMLYNFPYDESFGMFQFQLQTYLLVIKELEEYTKKNYGKAEVIRGEFLRANEILKDKRYSSSKPPNSPK